MKVIMDINKDILTDVKGTDFDRARNIVRSYQATIADAIRNSIVFPDNATNGDMIKAMFPNGKEYDNDGDVRYEIEIDFDYSFCSYFDGVWWNAPYKGNLSEKSTGSEREVEKA
jgi:hypothetical protein